MTLQVNCRSYSSEDMIHHWDTFLAILDPTSVHLGTWKDPCSIVVEQIHHGDNNHRIRLTCNGDNEKVSIDIYCYTVQYQTFLLFLARQLKIPHDVLQKYNKAEVLVTKHKVELLY